MLKMTNVELEKISDADKHLFIEKGMRGGISYVNKRYSRANNISISIIHTDTQWVNIYHMEV